MKDNAELPDARESRCLLLAVLYGDEVVAVHFRPRLPGGGRIEGNSNH
jgi:hypothetical protein